MKRVSCTFYAVILTGSVIFGFADNKAATNTGEVSYYKQIRPILQAHCQGCHQPAKAKGGYVMTDFAGLLKGGDHEGVAVVPGKPMDSAMLTLIAPDKDGETEMP